MPDRVLTISPGSSVMMPLTPACHSSTAMALKLRDGMSRLRMTLAIIRATPAQAGVQGVVQRD